MKVDEIVHDVFEILNALSDDRDIDELWLMNKINQHRAALIALQVSVSRTINPIWLQRIRRFKFTKVNAADDPVITLSSVQLGKYSMPPVVGLIEDWGLWRVSGSGAIRSLDPIDFNTLMLKTEVNDVESGYGYYSKIGNVIYCWPYIFEGSAMVIAENPFDIQKINALNTAMEAASVSDDYPLDAATAQSVIIEILTKELNIKMKNISDIVNDSQNQLNILKSNAFSAKE